MTNETQQTLKTPAIALLVFGILNGSTGFLALAGGVFRLLAGGESLPVAEAERIGFIIGTIITYGVALISLLIAPLVIYGAVQMMGGKKYGISRAASIAAMIPFASCCFFVGIPVGIWCFMILRKPEVREFFESGAVGRFSTPPPPPHNYG
jgi:hypothetical protein